MKQVLSIIYLLGAIAATGLCIMAIREHQTELAYAWGIAAVSQFCNCGFISNDD